MASAFKAKAKAFFNIFGPPAAGVAVGWSVWGAGEFVAPEKMHDTAISIHGITYRGQEWLTDNVLPSFVSDGLVKLGMYVPPPIYVLEEDRDADNESQSATMFREIFEQCRMQEGLDWLEENVTEEIPFIYINELFATWGSTFFWKHFLRKQQRKSDAKSEAGLESSPAEDLKSLAKRVERDAGECEIRVNVKVPSSSSSSSSSVPTDNCQNNDDDDEIQVNFQLKPGGEASFLEGIWYRFAVLEQLDFAAGWSTLAVLTQNKDNALALAKIALASSIVSTNDEGKISALLGGSAPPTTSSKEKSISMLCDADRCVWALASLMSAGLALWTKQQGSGADAASAPAMSRSAASTKPFLVATASVSAADEEKERKRKLRKERAAGKENPYRQEEEEQGGDVHREEKENREFMKLVMSKFDEVSVMSTKKESNNNSNNNNTKYDDEIKHSEDAAAAKGWELETERRWAIASADPFLVTLRNVDVALCEYLRQGADKASISRWYDFLGFGGNHSSRCPCIADAGCVGSDGGKELVKFLQHSQSSLVPSIKKHSGIRTSYSSQLFSNERFTLADYVGLQFARAASAGEVPFQQSHQQQQQASSSTLLRNCNLIDDELLAAADFLKRQSSVVKSWIQN